MSKVLLIRLLLFCFFLSFASVMVPFHTSPLCSLRACCPASLSHLAFPLLALHILINPKAVHSSPLDTADNTKPPTVVILRGHSLHMLVDRRTAGSPNYIRKNTTSALLQIRPLFHGIVWRNQLPFNLSPKEYPVKSASRTTMYVQ